MKCIHFGPLIQTKRIVQVLHGIRLAEAAGLSINSERGGVRSGTIVQEGLEFVKGGDNGSVMRYIRGRRGSLSFSVQEHGIKSCLSRAFNIVAWTVADGPAFIRFHNVLVQGGLENSGRRFRGVSETRNSYRVEQIGNAKPSEHSKEACIKIRHNSQFKSSLLEPSQYADGIRKQDPVGRPGKRFKDLFEVVIKSFKHAYPIEYIVNDIKPPKPFTSLDLSGIVGGEYRSRGIAKRS